MRTLLTPLRKAQTRYETFEPTTRNKYKPQTAPFDQNFARTSLVKPFAVCMTPYLLFLADRDIGCRGEAIRQDPGGSFGGYIGTLWTHQKSTRVPGWGPTQRAPLLSLYYTHVDLNEDCFTTNSTDCVCDP